MTPSSKRDALKVFHARYQKAALPERGRLLDEFCLLTGYHRKYAIALLNAPLPEPGLKKARTRRPTYGRSTGRVLQRIWEAAGYPWSVRLKALLPLWLPWARRHVPELTPEVERQLVALSPRQVDRLLHDQKTALGRRLYGRTKPGSLLKHHIPIRTDNHDIHEPGFLEIDLVSHSGDCASGEFLYSLNVTDLQTGWVETRVVKGKSERGVVQALEAIRLILPFPLKGLDSDNGSEFLNHHLVGYCQEHGLTFTRSRPYKKDDNAHIEQKNWTHVRKLMGWERYESAAAWRAMNGVYREALPRLMNLFEPSVKLLKKERVGSRLKRVYSPPQTPLDRLQDYYQTQGQPIPSAVETLLALRARLDPFELARSVEVQLQRIHALREGQAGGRRASGAGR